MSSYNELIALINGCINRNGVQAITGRVLNGVLRAMVNQLGAGYAMGGVAHPTDDPGTPEAPVCYYASEVGTYTHFGNIQIVPGELALLCFDLTDGWFKETMYEGFESVQATIDGNVGTPAVNVTYVNGVLSFDFSNMKGNTGAAAGFGNVTAAVDGTSGTPGVSVQTDGPDTAKNIAFQFTGLKGETGVTSVIATVDNTSGTPQCAVSLNGQQLTLAFTGLKGAQGDTGSSVAYPFTIVNNLTTNDATKALSAAMGVQLEAEVSQLEAKVRDFKGACYGVYETVDDLPEDAVEMGYAYVGASSPYAVYNFDGHEWMDSGVTSFDSVVTAEDLGEEIEAINLGPNVQYVAQELTAEQKEQARTNIGAGVSNFSGSYTDLSHKPTIPGLSTNIPSDKNDNTKAGSAKAIYELVFPSIVNSQPVGGFVPNVIYDLGILTGTVTFELAAPTDAAIPNFYLWTFETSSAAPSVTFPNGLSWPDGSAPTIEASKHYEIMVRKGYATFLEFAL